MECSGFSRKDEFSKPSTPSRVGTSAAIAKQIEYANDEDNQVPSALNLCRPIKTLPIRDAGISFKFPERLHLMLRSVEQLGLGHIVAWRPHGMCFGVNNTAEFVDRVLPVWFRQTKFASFQRQLNIYGFTRLTAGIDKNCYHHRFFIQGIEDVSAHLERITFKGNGARQPSSPESEPNFYDQSVCSSLRRIAVSSRVNLAASESLCGEKNINTFVQGQTSYGQRQQAPMCHTRNDAVVDSGRHLISGRSALIHPHFMNMLPTAFTLPNRGQVSNLVSNFIQHKITRPGVEEMVSYALNNHSLRAQNNIGILNADCFRSLLGSNAMVLNFEENLSDSSRDFQLQLSNQRLQEDISQLYSKNVRRLSEIKAHDKFMRSNDPK